FLDTHVNVGMVGAVENIGLAKRLPLGTALRMTLQGKPFRLTAKRAYELGLVEEVVPLADLASTAEQIARDIAANSPHATQLSKQAIWGSLEMGYRDALEYGWALLRMHWQHPDFQEARGPSARSAHPSGPTDRTVPGGTVRGRRLPRRRPARAGDTRGHPSRGTGCARTP
ncbi:MAG: enoyl-CoA hydratase/isomerase family protein, partial [Mycobacteriales bacterium]